MIKKALLFWLSFFVFFLSKCGYLTMSCSWSLYFLPRSKSTNDCKRESTIFDHRRKARVALLQGGRENENWNIRMPMTLMIPPHLPFSIRQAPAAPLAPLRSTLRPPLSLRSTPHQQALQWNMQLLVSVLDFTFSFSLTRKIIFTLFQISKTRPSRKEWGNVTNRLIDNYQLREVDYTNVFIVSQNKAFRATFLMAYFDTAQIQYFRNGTRRTVQHAICLECIMIRLLSAEQPG